MSSPEGTLQPAWDAEPEDPSTPSEQDLYAETGVTNLKGPARFTIACLALFIVFRLVGLFASGFIERSQAAPDDLMGIGVSLFGMAGLVSWGLGLPLGICTISGFLVWLVGAAQNAETIDQVRLRISPGWQAGWYFAPFFNLVVPAFGMNEIVSHSHLRHPDSAFLITLLWWSTWVLATFGIHLARTAGSPFPEESPFPYWTVLNVTAAILSASAAVFLIILMHSITKSQAAMAQAIGAEDPFEETEL